MKKPKFKSSVENAVGILEKGLFHILEERQYFSLEQFNEDLWTELEKLNDADFKAKPHNRNYYWQEEIEELQPLPDSEYHFMERHKPKVSNDYLVRFDNAYYAVNALVIYRLLVPDVKMHIFSGKLLILTSL